MLDCVIIGNGILGLSLAFRLKRDNPDMKLAVIGPSHRKGSATLAAGAMLNVWAEIVEGQFEDQFLSMRFNIARQGMDMWEPFAEEIRSVSGVEIPIKWGTYVINTPLSAPWGDKTWSYFIKALASQNASHKIVDPLNVPYLNPVQHSRPLDAALIMDGQLNPNTVLDSLDIAMERLGIVTYDTVVESIIEGHTFKLKLGDNSEVSVGQVVLANGTFAQKLIDQIPNLKSEVPRLLWGLGSAVELSFEEWNRNVQPNNPLFSMDCVIRGLNPVGACGLHVVPQDQTTFYIGASSAVLYEPEWNPRSHAIVFLIHNVVNEINRSFAFTTTKLRGNGVRPVTVDGFPLLGESNIRGLWFLNGMKRDGLTSAPYLVHEMAIQMSGKRSELPQEFSPTRPLIPYKNRKKAIEETVLFSINADRQHGLVMPPWVDEKYSQNKLDEIHKIYDKRGIKDFAIHPEVIHLYDNDEYYQGIKHRLFSSI